MPHIRDVHRASNDRLAEKLARAEREKNTLAEFVPLWPGDRPIVSLYHSTVNPSKLGEVTVAAEVETRADAIEYLSAFKLEPLVFLRGTFAGIYAKAWVPESLAEKADTEIDCLGAYWRYDSDVSTAAKLVAYFMIGTIKTHLTLRIKNDPCRRAVVYSGLRGMGKDVDNWIMTNAPGGEPVIFASGSPEYCGEVWMYFVAEPGGAAPDLKYYLLDQSRSVQWRRR